MPSASVPGPSAPTSSVQVFQNWRKQGFLGCISGQGWVFSGDPCWTRRLGQGCESRGTAAGRGRCHLLRGSLREPTDPRGANTLRCPQPRCRAPPWPSLPSAQLFLKLRSHRKTLAASALPTDAWICKRRGRKVGAGAGTSGIREHGSVHHCPWPLGGSWRLSERLHWAWEPPTWGPSPSPASRAGSPGGMADGGPLAPAPRCRSTK